MQKQTNPLMILKKWSDVFIGSFILLFFSVNILMIIFGSSSAFQRLGAFWIAIILFSFGIFNFFRLSLRLGLDGRGPISDIFNEKLSILFKTYEGDGLSLLGMAMKNQEKEKLSKDNFRYYLEEVDQYMMMSIVGGEILIAALATIQWGYGDLIHCWINGSGWTAC